MDVREIVKAHLEQHGYDGLYTLDCGCRLNDLFPCMACGSMCKPGYSVPADPRTGYDFRIAAEKPKQG